MNELFTHLLERSHQLNVLVVVLVVCVVLTLLADVTAARQEGLDEDRLGAQDVAATVRASLAR